MSDAERRRRLELQAKVLEGRRALQELAELQRGEQSHQQQAFPSGALNNIPQHYMGLIQQQSGPSRLQGVNTNGQFNVQGQRQVDMASLPIDPHQLQALAYAQFVQNVAGAMNTNNAYHNPNSISSHNSSSSDLINPNSNQQAQQAQLVRPNQPRVPTQGSTLGQNPLQQHLDVMTQAYSRNAAVPYISPNGEPSVQQVLNSNQQGHGSSQSHGAAPHNVQQQQHYRTHVYRAAGGAGSSNSGPSLVQAQHNQGPPSVTNPPNSAHFSAHPQAIHIPSALENSSIPVSISQSQSQPLLERPAPQPQTQHLPPLHQPQPQRPPPQLQHQPQPQLPPQPQPQSQRPAPPQQQQQQQQPQPQQQSQQRPHTQHPPPKNQPPPPQYQYQPQHPQHPPQQQQQRADQSPNTAVPTPGPQPNKERVVDLPSWSTSLLNKFKRQCFSYFNTAPVGATLDVYGNFKFALGFVFQKQSDGLWLVDTRDNMKAPLRQLIDELESRQVPDDAPGAMHTFGGPPATVANTARPTADARKQPPQRTSQRLDSASAALPQTIQIPATVPIPPAASPSLPNPNAPKPSAITRLPADANKKTLAKDILYALGKRTRPAEPDVGPDPKRPFMHAVMSGRAPGHNAPAMSTFRLGDMDHPQPVALHAAVAGPGGVIDLSQLPVLPAAPAKPYQPPFASTSSIPIRTPKPGPNTSAPPPPQTPALAAKETEAMVNKPVPSAASDSRPLSQSNIVPVTTPSQPPLQPVPLSSAIPAQSDAPRVIALPSLPPAQAIQAPQPRPAVPNRLNEALLVPPSKGTSPLHSQLVASSSNLTVVEPATTLSVPPIATIPDSVSPSGAPVAARVEGVQSGTKDSLRTPAQAAIRQYGKKGKGRALSVTSDATGQPPPSSSSSKASRVPPTSSSPGQSVVLGILSPSPRAVSSAASDIEPLFLPSDSPPQSPVLATSSLFIPKRTKAARKQHVACVLIPPPSPRTQRFMGLGRQGSSMPQSSKAPTSSRRSSSRATDTVAATRGDDFLVPPFTGEDVEYDYSFDQHGNSIEDPVERRLLELACTRMQEVECKWDRCPFVANSPISLLAHYKKYHRPPLRNGVPEAFSCQWTQCGKRCRFQEIRHFIKHALDSLTCPYSGCEDKFRTIGKLRRHVEKHADGSSPKPGCMPFRPPNLTPPRPSPTILPAYLTATPQVLPASIGPAKHARLLPWVKKGSSGLARRGQPRPRRIAAQAHGDSSLQGPRIERNEDLIDYATRYSSYVSEPSNISLCDLEDQQTLSRLSNADRLMILEEGTDCATFLWDSDEVKEEERSPSPLHYNDPLLLRSETASPGLPPQPAFEVLRNGTEEVDVVEGDQLTGDTQDGDDSEVEAMLL